MACAGRFLEKRMLQNRVWRVSTMQKGLSFATVLLCAVLLLTGCNGSSATYTAGTYTAAAEGYAGAVRVEVEFDENSILSVKVTGQNETAGIGDKAFEALPGKIVEAQTYEVDAVSTATVTSAAIKAAVKDCMEQAKR
ncbi:MAG: FMN-binding protein [Oscillospiraceae bacterium]